MLPLGGGRGGGGGLCSHNALLCLVRVRVTRVVQTVDVIDGDSKINSEGGTDRARALSGGSSGGDGGSAGAHGYREPLGRGVSAAALWFFIRAIDDHEPGLVYIIRSPQHPLPYTCHTPQRHHHTPRTTTTTTATHCHCHQYHPQATRCDFALSAPSWLPSCTTMLYTHLLHPHPLAPKTAAAYHNATVWHFFAGSGCPNGSQVQTMVGW